MKRTAIFIVLLSIIGLIPAAAEHNPEWPSSTLEIHTHGRLFSYWDDLSAMIEYTGRFEEPNLDFRYQSLMLGGYYRVLDELKVGAFYRIQVGARHDNDWIAVYPTWVWRDSSSRFEHLALLDVTPRFQLDFIPDGNWVFAVKNRYSYNFYNGHQKLLVRPGLTWFWLVDREPMLNISAQYSTYFSLNFGSEFWYQHGPYLNVLYHVLPWLAVDVSVGYQTIFWTESAEYIADHPGQSYPDNTYTPWVVDLGAIITLRN